MKFKRLITFLKMQKQPPEVFYKKVFLKNIHRKIVVLESLYNSAYYKTFKSTYFEEHLRTDASENEFIKLRKITNC